MDSSGTLKYDDFNLARLEGENLDELFEMTLAEGTQPSDQNKQDDENGSKSTLGNQNQDQNIFQTSWQPHNPIPP